MSQENTTTSYTWKKKIKSTCYFFSIFAVAILFAILIRVFLFASYSIPSPSMEPALMAGDRIIVNKLIPGPRIIKNFFSLKKGEEAELLRLNGYRQIKRNDILVFNFPYSDWHRLQLNLDVYYAKRCIGIPGDTISIVNGFYTVRNIRDTLGFYPDQEKFSNLREEEIDPVIYHCFPFDERYNWNAKNFGPLYIPAKGEVLPVDSMNIKLYENLIRYETKKDISVKGKEVWLGDSLIREYTFGKDYYFMAGDLVGDSKDSRYWGLLPEDHIIGKVVLVWKSKDMYTGKTRWDRVLKRVP